MKSPGNTKSKIAKDENREDVPHLEITEVTLVHCNIDNNNSQQDSRVLYIFVPNNLFGQLLDTSPKNFMFLQNFISELSFIKVWFTDQNSEPLGMAGKM